MNIRAISKKLRKTTAVMADLQGPKFRTGKLEGGKPVELKNGDVVKLVCVFVLFCLFAFVLLCHCGVL